MIIPEFQTCLSVPEDFSGFWKCTKNEYIGYYKNGEFENIFGACAFYPSGIIGKLVEQNRHMIRKLFPRHSEEAKKACLEFKMYMIMNHL